MARKVNLSQQVHEMSCHMAMKNRQPLHPVTMLYFTQLRADVLKISPAKTGHRIVPKELRGESVFPVKIIHAG